MMKRRRTFGLAPRDSKRLALAIAFAVAGVALGGDSEVFAQGCAMCRTALGGPEDPLARGLNVSILFLLSMPFVLLGTVGGWFFYMFRRDHRRRSALRLLTAHKEGAS